MIYKISFFPILFLVVVSLSFLSDAEAVQLGQRDLMQEHMDQNFPKPEQVISPIVTETPQAHPTSLIQILIGLVPIKIIFIAVILIRRVRSRKKRKVRTHREIRSDRIEVTPYQYDQIQEFERKFTTDGMHDPEEFLHKTSGAKLIDASKRGNELYAIDNLIPGKSIKILKYRDPSTVQLFISIVPFEIENADEAMAWKFHLTRKEYARLRNEG